MKRALVLVFLLACSSATSNKLPAEAWGVDDFTKAGLVLDKPWTAADFDQALTVLRDATTDHRERLPRFQGPKSGAVFAKLIADLPDDSGNPIADRFAAHVQHYGAVNQISKLYMQNALDAPTREWIELMGSIMREAAMLSTSADAFMATIPADDPSREARLDGLAKMRDGYGMMLLGSLLVTDQLRVPEADRVALAEHVAVAMPTLFRVAPAATQAQLRETLGKLREGLPAGKLRDTIAAIHQALPPA